MYLITYSALELEKEQASLEPQGDLKYRLENVRWVKGMKLRPARYSDSAANSLPANAGDEGSNPGLGRFSGNPLPTFLPGKSHGREAWPATPIHGVANSQGRLSN